MGTWLIKLNCSEYIVNAESPFTVLTKSIRDKGINSNPGRWALEVDVVQQVNTRWHWRTLGTTQRYDCG